MTDFVRPGWIGRLQRVRKRLLDAQLDALVVSTPHNITYLCGFAGSSGLLLVTASDAWLVTDGRYSAVVREGLMSGALGPVTYEPVETRYDLALAGLMNRIGVARAGFEAAHVTVAMLRGWQERVPSVTFSPTDDEVELLRIVKDDFEIALIRKAARALAGVARRLGDVVKPGRTEREVARAVDDAIARAGFERVAFETIVAAGPNSAHPHARPTDRRLGQGDLVMLDFGGVLDGYCVDLTRMAGIGHVGAEAEALFSAVQAAQEAAIASVRAGVMSSAVDRAARDVLDARGYGEAFCHGTGHGLGLDVHEAPRLTRAESVAGSGLEAGMVCTIEPGAYIEGLGGVRLEDDVLVTAGGCEVLTDAPRDLLVV